MRILITEEALRGEEGHFLNYLKGIARGLRAAGDSVDLLAHRGASPAVVAQTEAVPWFRRDCRTDSGSQGLGGFVKHNYSTYRDLERWLKGKPNYNWLLNLATRRQQLLAFSALAYNRKIMPQGRLLLLFVIGFGQYNGRRSDPVFPRDPSTLLCRLIFWCLRPAVRSGRVVLAAETREMTKELGLFCRLPVQQLPHPVNWPEEGRFVAGRAERPQLFGPAVKDRFVVTCPGFARFEKGSDLLVDAIRELGSQKEDRDYFFVMQWLKPFTTSDGMIYKPNDELEKSGAVKVIADSMSVDQYRAVLEASDAVILPYRTESYRNRVSRIAIEAAALGIPLIYSKGTWIEEVAETARVGIPIEAASATAIIAALQKTKSQRDKLLRKAELGAERVKSFYSLDEFRRVLEKL